MVWIPLFLDPSDGVFGRFDLAALCGCRTLNFCLFCFDVVDLPDILLPAGQYLDLFDSESETDVPSDSSDEELVEV